jgi:hypothetical protein
MSRYHSHRSGARDLTGAATGGLALFCGASDAETGRRLNVRQVPTPRAAAKPIDLLALRLVM